MRYRLRRFRRLSSVGPASGRASDSRAPACSDERRAQGHDVHDHLPVVRLPAEDLSRVILSASADHRNRPMLCPSPGRTGSVMSGRSPSRSDAVGALDRFRRDAHTSRWWFGERTSPRGRSNRRSGRVADRRAVPRLRGRAVPGRPWRAGAGRGVPGCAAGPNAGNCPPTPATETGVMPGDQRRRAERDKGRAAVDAAGP